MSRNFDDLSHTLLQRDKSAKIRALPEWKQKNAAALEKAGGALLTPDTLSPP